MIAETGAYVAAAIVANRYRPVDVETRNIVLMAAKTPLNKHDIDGPAT